MTHSPKENNLVSRVAVETSFVVPHHDEPQESIAQSDGNDIYNFTSTTICKPTFDYLEEVLPVQKFQSEQLEVTNKIV